MTVSELDSEDRRPLTPVATVEEQYELLARARTAAESIKGIHRLLDRQNKRIRALELRVGALEKERDDDSE